MSDTIRLTGLDGSNPLAFLAAIGTHRLLSTSADAAGVRMRWVAAPHWLPEVSGLTPGMQGLPEALLCCPGAPVEALLSTIGPNLTVGPDAFRAVAASAASDPELAPFVASFGCEAVNDGKRAPRIRYTDLCFITGSGHQNFLETAVKLRREVTVEDLRAALFGPWVRQRKKGMSFRWDPGDAAEYALQWADPSADGAASVPGANWLAFEALPCFPVQPRVGSLRTTGFTRARRPWPRFRWPIWTVPASVDTVRSLLASSALCDRDASADSLGEIAARGVARVYESARVRIGQGANFKVSFRPAAALM